MSTVPDRATEPEGLRYGEPTWDVAQLFPLQGTWTESEYFALETSRRVEFSNGFIEFPADAEAFAPNELPLFLYNALRAFVLGMGLVEVHYSGVRVRLWLGKFREPDVLFMRTSTMRIV